MDRLESLLAKHPEVSHIRVKKHGDSLLLCSGEGDDLYKHARLTKLGRDLWGISMPANGRWQKTPFIGPMRETIDILVGDLGPFLRSY